MKQAFLIFLIGRPQNATVGKKRKFIGRANTDGIKKCRIARMGNAAFAYILLYISTIYFKVTIARRL